MKGPASNARTAWSDPTVVCGGAKRPRQVGLPVGRVWKLWGENSTGPVGHQTQEGLGVSPFCRYQEGGTPPFRRHNKPTLGRLPWVLMQLVPGGR